jgi:sulfite dehydrogenase
MSHGRIIFAGAIAAASLTVSLAVHSQQPPSKASQKAAKSSGSPVQSIELPQYPPDIPKGPNVEVYEKDCLLCHTARYVSMQPRFSKAVWQGEVKKMVDVHGAPLPEADQALIVEYLVAVKGTEPTAPAPPK